MASSSATAKILSDINKRRAEDAVNGVPEAKRHATSPYKPTKPETVLRMLVPAKRIGGIIGKGGTIVKTMREETGARIKAIEAIPGCDERVVVISSKDDPAVEHNNAQIALFQVNKRVLDGEEGSSEFRNANPQPKLSVRLLVCHTQASSLLERQAKAVIDICDTSGAHMKILTADELPRCALANDRVIELHGNSTEITNAVQLLSQHLRQHPPTERPRVPIPATAEALPVDAPPAQGGPGWQGAPPPAAAIPSQPGWARPQRAGRMQAAVAPPQQY